MGAGARNDALHSPAVCIRSSNITRKGPESLLGTALIHERLAPFPSRTDSPVVADHRDGGECLVAFTLRSKHEQVPADGRRGDSLLPVWSLPSGLRAERA